MNTEIIVALIGGVVTIGNVVFTTVINNYKKKDGRLAALEDGVRGLLRTKIIDYYEKYMELGYCPIYAKEALRRMYKAYHALGGNDVATDLYKKVILLPDKPRGHNEE